MNTMEINRTWCRSWSPCNKENWVHFVRSNLHSQRKKDSFLCILCVGMICLHVFRGRVFETVSLSTNASMVNIVDDAFDI